MITRSLKAEALALVMCVSQPALTDPSVGLGHGGHFHLALGSFLIDHPSPLVTLLLRLFSHLER